MAVAIGIVVANLYYLQPLLHQVRQEFAISTLATSSLITLIQASYAAGLMFVVPLGDILPRRRLIVAIFALASVAMLLGSFVRSFVLFALITAVIGLCSVGGQVIIPFAADLAVEGERGRVIGRLMTGLLTGALLSRALSGALAEAVGWRGVYVSAAILLAIMTLVLRLVLPVEEPRPHVAYRELVTSSFTLLGTYRELRRRAWLGGVNFAAFSALWTTLAFELSGAPFHYSSGRIGLFALLGIAGVLAANAAGHQADKNRSRRTTSIASILITVAYLILLVGRHDIWVLGIGIVVLDIGVQGIQITNQAVIYKIAPEMRSRTNGIYMMCFFTGGALGSLAAGFAYSHFSWPGVTGLGILLGLLLTVPSLIWREPTSNNAHVTS
ncbi:MAG: MFS transporter [Acidimicrobiales bacterium]